MNSDFELLMLQERVADMARLAEQRRRTRPKRLRPLRVIRFPVVRRVPLRAPSKPAS